MRADLHPVTLRARALGFGYRASAPLLQGVDLDVPAGQLVVLLGRNGSGKTTLLRCLLGFLNPAAGAVELEDRPLASYRPRERARRLAYVPQNPGSAFDFTAEDIVLSGRLAHQGSLGLAGRTDLDIVHLAMEMTGVADLRKRTLAELSGGEAQCVMIARALAQQPAALLLDEPTSHLDLANQLRIFAMLRRIARDWPMAVLCVAHDINLAARYADRLALLADGRILAAGAPAEVVRADLLEQAYGVRVDLVPHGTASPLVWPRDLCG